MSETKIDNYNSRECITKELYDLLIPKILLKTFSSTDIETKEICELKFVNFNYLLSNGDIEEKTYRWKNGSLYNGLFRENQITGAGKLIDNIESKYEGSFFAGQMHGNGIYESEKDIYYIGHFSNGKYDGQGMWKSKSRGCLKGIFKNGRILSGVHSSKRGIFKGTFDEFGSRKQGKFKFPNNDTYEGSFVDDMFCDFGIYRWNEQKAVNECALPARYIGTWNNGQRHGVGRLEFKERTVTCIWQMNLKHGPGMIAAANGDYYVSLQMYCQNQYLAQNCLRIKKCNKSKVLIAGALNVATCLDSNEQKISNSELLQLRETTFTSKISEIARLFGEENTCRLLLYPLLIPNYELSTFNPFLDLPSRDSSVELNSLQQIVTENYSKLNNIYNRYIKLGFQFYSFEQGNRANFVIKCLGLWQFYRDIFHCTYDVNIAECIRDANNTYNIWFEYNDINFLTPVYFWEFLTHCLHITTILTKNENFKKYVSQHRPKFFDSFAVEFLVFLRLFDELNLNDFKGVLRVALATNQACVLKLFKVIHDFHVPNDEYQDIRTFYRFILAKNISPPDGSLTEIAARYFPLMTNFSTKICSLLYKSEFLLTPLECFEIVISIFENIEQLHCEETENIEEESIDDNKK